MPTYMENDGVLSTKLVCFYNRGAGSTLPSVSATVLLLDPESGHMKAVSSIPACTCLSDGFGFMSCSLMLPTRRSWMERQSLTCVLLELQQSRLRYFRSRFIHSMPFLFWKSCCSSELLGLPWCVMQLLMRHGAEVLAILGTGQQAPSHYKAFTEMLSFKEVCFQKIYLF